MCQNYQNPLNTIVEVSEMFQEFLRLASLDGLIDSWCLEITLRMKTGSKTAKRENFYENLQHVFGLHSLGFLILQKLDDQNHDSTSGSCSCGWEESLIPEIQHSNIHRYTPGTIIRWSQGACHLLLPPVQGRESIRNWPVRRLKQEQEASSSPLENNEEEINRSGVIQTAINIKKYDSVRSPVEETDKTIISPQEECSPQSVNDIKHGNTQTDPVSIGEGMQSSHHFIESQHFCKDVCESMNHLEEELSQENHIGEQPNQKDTFQKEEENEKETNHPSLEGAQVILEDSFTNGLWEDDENSRMLVINEDVTSQEEDPDMTSQEEDPSEKGGGSERSDIPLPTSPPVSFHRVLPLTVDNVRTFTGDSHSSNAPSSAPSSPTPLKQDEEDADDGDSSSVSSSSSTSSSSTSSSSTSSDDDDRIHFKKIVEQAAQAAREAAASAAASNIPPSHENSRLLPPHSTFTEGDPSFPPGLPSNENGGGANGPGSSPDHLHSEASFAAFRHPDDIQAAQGLAALGKSHEFKQEEEAAPISPIAKAVTLRTCKITQKLIQNSNLELDVRRVGRKSFQCGVCGKLFPRLTKALEHNVAHSGAKPWECDLCDKTYARHMSLQKHKKAKHTPSHLQDCACYICDKNFGVQGDLQMHLATHATHKPYSCSVCGKTFAQKFTRNTHEAQHTGNRPWVCNVCGKSFVTKYKLKSHMKGHTGELFCKVCNRTFSSQDVLTRHKRRHESGRGNQTNVSFLSKLRSPKQRKQPQVKDPIKSLLKEGSTPVSYSESSVTSSPVSSGFRCQMCNKIFIKSTDLTHHLASCNAITYCPPLPPPPSNIQAGLQGTSLLTEAASNQPLNIHPQPETSQNTHPLHHQPLPPSASPLTTCLLVEEKKLFTSCDSASNVGGELEGLERRGFLMNNLQTQTLTAMVPYQHQETIISTPSNTVTEGLPDYLSEVAFGATSANTSAIIFQPAHGQG